jgi:hypothetical protein
METLRNHVHNAIIKVRWGGDSWVGSPETTPFLLVLAPLRKPPEKVRRGWEEEREVRCRFFAHPAFFRPGELRGCKLALFSLRGFGKTLVAVASFEDGLCSSDFSLDLGASYKIEVILPE